MNYKIRKAELTDLPSICDLSEQLFDYESEAYDSHSYDREWSKSSPGREFFAKQVVSDNSLVLIAESNDSVIGYLVGNVTEIAYRTPKKTAELINLYILDEYRSKGIGSELIQEFRDFAKEKEAVRLRVMQHHDNERGLKFYKKYGFEDHARILEQEL